MGDRNERLLDVAEPGRVSSREPIRARALAHELLVRRIVEESQEHERRVVLAAKQALGEGRGWRPSTLVSGEQHCASRMLTRGVFVLERRGGDEFPAFYLTPYLGLFVANAFEVSHG